MMNETNNIKPFLTSSALIEKFEDEFVIYLPETTSTYLAEPLTVLILSYCNGKNNIPAIIKKLVGVYPEKHEEIARDLPLIIEEMIGFGILQR